MERSGTESRAPAGARQRRRGPLARRVRRPELMDDPALPAAEHRRALAGLRRINRVSGIAGALWRVLREVAPARVLDLGSGGGEVPVALARRARRAGAALDVQGSDASERAVAWAREHAAREGVAVRFERLDATAGELPAGYDVVMCSLLLHHLDDDAACALLAAMGRAARRLVLVCDLARTGPGLALAWAGTRVLSRSRVVHVDGVRSVRAAFTAAEALALARRAGLREPRVEPCWPCRWLLTSRAT